MSFLTHKSKRLSSNSLFIRLLAGFLIVIVFFASLSLLSLAFFKSKINQQITEYNQLNIRNTAQSYESRIELVKSTIYSLLFSDPVKALHVEMVKENKINYYSTSEVMQEINKKIINNPTLYIHNILVYYKQSEMVIEKNGVSNADLMLGTFYKSDSYDMAKWKLELGSEETFKILPAAVFPNVPYQHEELIPIIIKNKFDPFDMSFIVFLDAAKMFKELHHSINNNFCILNANRETIYASNNGGSFSLPNGFGNPQGYVKTNDHYYFYDVGPITELTYINTIPMDRITLQIVPLVLLLLAVLAGAIGISLVFSIFYSLQIHNPIRSIVESINTDSNVMTVHKGGGRIQEFEVIRHNFQQMLQREKESSENINKRDSLLQNYALIHKIKNIPNQIIEMGDLAFKDKPFALLLFHVKFKDDYRSHYDIEPEQITRKIREFIEQAALAEFSNSFCVQTEKDQILMLLFTKKRERISELLVRIKQVFDTDRAYYLVTTSVSSFYKHSIQLKKSFEEVKALQVQRRLMDESQSIMPPVRNQPEILIAFAEEQKFYNNLLSGQKEAMFGWIKRYLRLMEQKDAFSTSVEQFATDLVKKIKMNMLSMNLDIGETEKLSQTISNCNTYDD
jgi:two-component system response regulator YesN